jgi:hypothetical protein
MKLFDRNVDFAPFIEDTPLYTLAREWMENKPHRMRLACDMQDLQDSDPLSSSQGSSSSVLSNVSTNNLFSLLVKVCLLIILMPSSFDTGPKY